MEREKILIVDDEPRILEAFRRHLIDDFDVLTAKSAEQGLEIISSNSDIAVILADYKMPGKDGVKFLAETRQLLPDSIRVIITGYANVDNALQAVNEGQVFRFLTKPLAIERLTRVIKEGIVEFRINKFKRELFNKTVGADYQQIQSFLENDWQQVHYEILRFLKKKEAGYADPVGSDSLGDSLNITPSYIRGVIGPLVDSGVVGVRMGRRGGYYLNVDPSLLLDWEELMGFKKSS